MEALEGIVSYAPTEQVKPRMIVSSNTPRRVQSMIGNQSTIVS